MLHFDPEAPTHFDFVVCESTYGGRDRFERSEEGRRDILAREVTAAAKSKGALLIPSFAVERTQELVTDLVKLMERGDAPGQHLHRQSAGVEGHADLHPHAKALCRTGRPHARLQLAPCALTESVEDSKALARFTGFRIIVSASGMCDAGRIRHHLKNHLWQPSTTVLMAGFQAEGSLGRILEDGAKTVTIMGETISVAGRHPPDGGLLRPRRWPGTRAMGEGAPSHRPLDLPHPWRRGGPARRWQAISARSGHAHDCVVIPSLDSVYELSGEAASYLAEETKPRIDPTMVARLDSHNDLADLILDIQRCDAKRGRREGARRHPAPPAPRVAGRERR
jgi:metallo-beta-lactamase family protein